MPRRGLGVFDRLRCSVEWEHCLSAGIRNSQVVRNRRERETGLRQLQPSLCLSLPLQGQFWSEVWFWGRGHQIFELPAANLSSWTSTQPSFRQCPSSTRGRKTSSINSLSKLQRPLLEQQCHWRRRQNSIEPKAKQAGSSSSKLVTKLQRTDQYWEFKSASRQSGQEILLRGEGTIIS